MLYIVTRLHFPPNYLICKLHLHRAVVLIS